MSETKAITYTESREAFFVKKLKKAERGLDNLVKYGTDPDACAKSGEEVAFYQDALAALRAEEEREKGCGYCTGENPLPIVENCYSETFIVYNRHTNKFYDGIYPLDWIACPMCGRKLDGGGQDGC